MAGSGWVRPGPAGRGGSYARTVLASAGRDVRVAAAAPLRLPPAPSHRRRRPRVLPPAARAAGYRDHVVICGWNSTARELVAELQTDEYPTKVVVLHDADKDPAGNGVYFVAGDVTSTEDLTRAGIEEAMAAVVCPADASNEADMRSILAVMAIESIAPDVRTVVEVNNPKHVDHFRRAHADEILVTSRIASRLLARSSLYPGVSELVTDIVSGGQGSELYRIALPADYCGLSIDDLAARLRADHRATLLAVSRDGAAHVNPAADFGLRPGDDAVVVAESLGTLAPLRLQHD